MENLETNIEILCRACLTPTTNCESYSLRNHNILINQQTFEWKSLAEIYNRCTHISSESQNLQWEWICHRCLQKFVDFFEFQRKCIDSFDRLCEGDVKREPEEIEQDIKREDEESVQSNLNSEYVNIATFDSDDANCLSDNKGEDEEVTKKALLESKNRMFECEYCQRKFNRKDSLLAHMRDHFSSAASSAQYACDFDGCDKKYKIKVITFTNKFYF